MGGFQNIWDQNWDKKRYRTDLGPRAKIQDQIRDKKSYMTDLETLAKLHDQIHILPVINEIDLIQ